MIESSFNCCNDDTERERLSPNFERNFLLKDGCLDFINSSRLGATLASCSALLTENVNDLLCIVKNEIKIFTLVC